ncbi:MAG: hypothetical protein FWE74_08985 [Oscillospiraceae bacterium]|nr:hypothetical protein [Oscillospiraceae bacterium]
MKIGLTEVIILHDNNAPAENFEEITRKNGRVFFNTLKKSQGEGEIRITLGAFGEEYKFYTDDTPVSSVRPMTKYFVNGNGVRNVFDSLANTMIEKGKAYSASDESEHPENIIVVLTTFGRDNASKNYTYNQVADMVAHQSGVYKWRFISVTAEPLVPEQLGIPQDFVIGIDKEEDDFWGKALNKLSEKILSQISK